MADPVSTVVNETAAVADPSFNLNRAYLKGASIEMPNAPGIFLEQGAPDIEMEAQVARQHLDGDFHEVAVQVTLTARTNGKTLFLVEATQAGIFTIENVPPADLAPLQEIVCAGIVFQYLRPNVADLITRMGLPPVHLSEVDFNAFYMAKLESASAESQTATQQ